MRLFVKLLLLIMIMAVAGLFLIKAPDGNPLLTTAAISLKTGQGIASLQQGWRDTVAAINRSFGGNNTEQIEVYKWQDDSGQWHYSDAAPANEDAELLQVDPNVNRMDPVEVSKTSDRTADTKTADNPPADRGLLQTLPTPGRIEKALRETQEVRQQFEERNETMQKKLDEHR